MVFKPLGVFRQLFCAFRSCQIFKVDNAFPRCLHAQRVAITFSESVYKIDQTFRVFQPGNGVGVESAEVACSVVFYEQVYHLLLFRCVGKWTCLQEVFYDLLDGLSVESAYAPYAFLQFSVVIAYKTAVHAHHDGLRIKWCLALGVEFFSFFLRDSGRVVIGCRSQHQVIAVLLVDAHGHYCRIENDREYFIAQSVHALPFCNGQFSGVNLFQGIAQFLRFEVGQEFVTAVVMVYAGGEPYAFEIS